MSRYILRTTKQQHENQQLLQQQQQKQQHQQQQNDKQCYLTVNNYNFETKNEDESFITWFFPFA